MRIGWLVVVIVSLVGLILYGVSEYAYDHGQIYGSGANPVHKEDLTGLPAWVRFYREHDLFVIVAPLVTLGIGGGGYIMTIGPGHAVGRHLRKMLTWFLPVARNGLKLRAAVRSNNGIFLVHSPTKSSVERLIRGLPPYHRIGPC